MVVAAPVLVGVAGAVATGVGATVVSVASGLATLFTLEKSLLS